MKRIKRRTVALFILMAFIASGLGVYLFKLGTDGAMWASFYANDSVYSGGDLSVGTICDRNGVVLSYSENGTRYYSDDELTKLSTLHAVGDRNGNIGTGALYTFTSKLIGYNIFTGTHSIGTGGTLYLSIDAALNKTAYKSLDGRSGTVAVCDIETGQILCMVSSPSFDPDGDGSDIEESSGAYLNRFLSSAFTPGSIFKLVTLAAAIENISNLETREFLCEGSVNIAGDTVTCTNYHGYQSIEDALANSCNCAFAELSMELGADRIAEYAASYGLTESFSVSGLKTAAGNFDTAEANSADLAWSGIGQYTDLVNPASVLRFMSAIANDGKAVELSVISKYPGFMGIGTSKVRSGSETQIMRKSTADQLRSMMSYNVTYQYGVDNFPDINLFAKSGTAEVGNDNAPHAWFVGFAEKDGRELAFVVLVENGGWGAYTAGSVANDVLQEAFDSLK